MPATCRFINRCARTPSYDMRAGVWIVAPQNGFVAGQLPMPAAGFLSEVKMPPAKTPISVDCAKPSVDSNSVPKRIPRILFKLTSQQKFNCCEDYKWRRAHLPPPSSQFGTTRRRDRFPLRLGL